MSAADHAIADLPFWLQCGIWLTVVSLTTLIFAAWLRNSRVVSLHGRHSDRRASTDSPSATRTAPACTFDDWR